MSSKVLLDAVKFDVDRETKGAIRFKEDAETYAPAVNTLYIRKRALGEWRKAIGIVVTIEVMYDD